MKEEEINNVMDNITEDSSLCIIREALTQYKENNLNKDWEFIERFFQYWRENLIISGFRRDETYNSFMPTDKDIFNILKEIKKND